MVNFLHSCSDHLPELGFNY